MNKTVKITDNNYKTELLSIINEIIADRKLTQVEAGKVLGLHQSKISSIKHLKTVTFTQL